MNPSQLSSPRIVCAAVKYGSMIICGARHLDMIMHGVLEVVGYPEGGVQGFIDQHGTFYTREEAWPIAVANDQIRRRVGGDEGRLYSENLY